jgi:RNA polymerase sigma factor (sigma-70 family)
LPPEHTLATAAGVMEEAVALVQREQGDSMSAMQSASEVKGLFPATHWTVVLAAGRPTSPQAQAALETLCRAYWYPLYAFVRHRGHSPEDAQDLVQGFFAQLLARKDLARVERDRGRFRCFLLASVRHFLANEWDRERAAKRGGGAQSIPLDEVLAESQFTREPMHELTAEKLYERSWAWTLLERVRTRLREEFRAHDKSARFELLEKFLPGEESDLTYAEVGARLALSEGTIKAEIHRLRERYRAVLRDEIAQTVASPDDVAEEIHHLMEVVGG